MVRFIGSIEGEVKTTCFSILLSTSDVEKGSFVKINHEAYGWVLARIDGLKRYMADGDEVLMADAKTIGYKDKDQVLIPKSPFKPNEKVYAADKELIMEVMGLSRFRSKNIYLGILEGHDIPVYLDIGKTIGKHVSVLAKTGAGKSYTVAVLLEELLKNNIPIVVIDPHGEYSTLRDENDDFDRMVEYGVKPKNYANKIKEYAVNILINPDAVKLTLNPKFNLQELIDIIPMKLTDRQKSLLYEALKRLEHKDYTIKDLINVVKMEGDKSGWKVISGLETLRNSGIFDGRPLTQEDIVREGQATIINLKGAEPQIQELVITKIAGDLFNSAKIGELPAFFFLVEEAHNFCPERGFGDVLSSALLRNIASEGRKFGFHLCVVSQRPARVDKNVLSQCNTQIILKVNNPNDLRAISQSIEGFTSGMETDIKQLSVGQALLVGECVEQPITVNIRARETRHKSSVKVKDKTTPPIEEKKGLRDKIKPIFIKDESHDKINLREIEKTLKKKAKKEKTTKDKLVSIFLKDEDEV
ncbi:MAG: ATPase [Candidatus Altiarchaeales archaeon ex4484_96]|nr:MAG: ATPase [Candidatus Altiarchaeales archaeon ex4484_96]